MDTLSRDAAELSIGLRLGLVPQAEIVAWADDAIARLKDPPLPVIDLALMSKAHSQDVLGKLSELSGGVPPIDVLPQALGRYTDRLRKCPEAGPVVAKGLWDIYVQSDYNVPSELRTIAYFDDDYWLALNETYGTERDVYARLLSFFERFEHV
jgi:hypothetical protein